MWTQKMIQHVKSILLFSIVKYNQKHKLDPVNDCSEAEHIFPKTMTNKLNMTQTLRIQARLWKWKKKRSRLDEDNHRRFIKDFPSESRSGRSRYTNRSKGSIFQFYGKV